MLSWKSEQNCVALLLDSFSEVMFPLIGHSELKV